MPVPFRSRGETVAIGGEDAASRVFWRCLPHGISPHARILLAVLHCHATAAGIGSPVDMLDLAEMVGTGRRQMLAALAEVASAGHVRIAAGSSPTADAALAGWRLDRRSLERRRQSERNRGAARLQPEIEGTLDDEWA